VSLTYGLIFLGLCLAAHVFIRVTLPHADPYCSPGRGAGVVRDRDDLPDQRHRRAASRRSGFVLGLILFAATIVASGTTASSSSTGM